MGRGKHEHCWKHVRRVENGLKWICNYCNGKFSGGATRIEAHLGVKGGGIRRCSNYPVVCNEGVHNNIMASTSSNSPEDMINRVYSTQDRVAEGVPEVIGTHIRNSVNHQNSAEIMNLFEGEQDWELFILKLGHCGTPVTLPQEIEKIASPIVARCDGLPLGITVMARIMKGIDDIHQWKHALNKINKLEMGQEVVEEVFKVLKRSFDNLMEKDLQNSFLYCALLSNDDKFEKDELIMKLVENGLINGNRYLEEIFHEGNYVLKTLESHSLIILYDSFACTHRLVKDMACYILKENQRNVMVMFEKELTKIVREWAADLELVHLWNCDIKEIPEGMSPYCPRLSTLIINQLPISHVPESFFKYMDIVSILDLSFNRKLEYLPNSLTKLKSLVSLVLKECVSLKHVPPLEELQALSRLVISHSSIAEAPQGLEKLTNLKWLDLSKNMSLNLELRSFSSKLTKLEYLDLRETNVAFTFEDVQGMNMLECFGGTFDCKHYNQSMQKNLGMSFGLKTYNLIIGNVCGESRPFWWSYINLKSFVAGDPNIKTVQFGDCDQLSYMLPKDLTCLRIDTNNHWICLCDSLSCSAASSLSTIRTSDCQQLESLFCLSRSCSFCTKINNLEVLKLSYLESLIVVIKDVGDVRQSLSPNGLFSWLKRFHIYGCNMIEKLLPARLVQQLQNLEIISVIKCNSMKEIFAVENSDDNDNSRIILPKLNFMNLTDLPQLKIVCKGNIRCRSLPYLIIRHCPSLERHPTIEI